MKTVGKKIRLLRHQQGWSQEEVAKKLDISIPAFSKIETGVTDVNLSRIEQIATLFGLSVVELLTFDEDEGTSAHRDQLIELQEMLKGREDEVINLQRKVIELFEALKHSANHAAVQITA